MQNNDENEITEQESAESCEFYRPIRILMLVTNCDKFGSEHKTGVWFEEFAVPYLRFKEEKYFVTVASLKGGKAPLDPASTNLIDDIKWHDAKKALEDTTPLESIDYTFYDALVIPGGHGPMFDLAKSDLTGEIVNYFDSKNKLIAAICHGPAGLLPAGTEFLDGRKLTCFTNAEEIAAKKDSLVPFSLEDSLKEKGATFIEMPEGEVNVVLDQNLITAQNYQSVEQFTSEIIDFLS